MKDHVEQILAWDRAAQIWVETQLAHPVMDLLMRGLSSLAVFVPMLLYALWWLVYRQGARGRALALGALLLVVLTDQGSSSVLKPLFGRERPHGGGLAFPSSHASNVFAQVVFFARAFPQWTRYLLPLAFLVAFSRVYLGKHFPLDVGGGAVFGSVLGWIAFAVVRDQQRQIDRGYRWLRPKLPRALRPEEK